MEGRRFSESDGAGASRILLKNNRFRSASCADQRRRWGDRGRSFGGLNGQLYFLSAEQTLRQQALERFGIDWEGSDGALAAALVAQHAGGAAVDFGADGA